MGCLGSILSERLLNNLSSIFFILSGYYRENVKNIIPEYQR